MVYLGTLLPLLRTGFFSVVSQIPSHHQDFLSSMWPRVCESLCWGPGQAPLCQMTFVWLHLPCCTFLECLTISTEQREGHAHE